MKFLKIFPFFLMSACATSPTGRTQLIMMPDSQMDSMGRQAFTEMKKTTSLVRDQKIVKYVECVAYTVAAEAHEAGVETWEVQTFNEKTVNAFALPGGKMGVYKGLLDVAVTEGQLAAVLGHEVGHVIARHGNERVSAALATQGGMIAADVALKDSPQRGNILVALGVGASLGNLAYGRSHESEADVIGLELMAKAGFDPRESVKLWQNMEKHGGGGPPEWLSTHPSHSTRINQLRSKMDRAMALYGDAQARGKNPHCDPNAKKETEPYKKQERGFF